MTIIGARGEYEWNGKRGGDGQGGTEGHRRTNNVHITYHEIIHSPCYDKYVYRESQRRSGRPNALLTASEI